MILRLSFLIALFLATTIGFQDWLVNAQLWLSVGVMEYFLDFLPPGIFFHSILDEILKAMGILENKRLKDLMMNRHISTLIEYMRNDGGFDGSKISLTGHSMGGGVALVSGAQTNTPAISVSGKVVPF